jgi:hypothetical protein
MPAVVITVSGNDSKTVYELEKASDYVECIKGDSEISLLGGGTKPPILDERGGGTKPPILGDER